MEKLEHSALAAKAFLTGIFAVISAFIGWFGWLILAFIGCLLLDLITGTAAAMKNGDWASKAARAGIGHKVATAIVVVVSAILDAVLVLILNHPEIPMPIEYKGLICPIVVLWYIFTEIGSIIENAEKLGAPVPPFLRSILRICQTRVERKGEELGGEAE